MNGELRVFPELGYVVVALSNLDPPAAQVIGEFFTLRMPVDNDTTGDTTPTHTTPEED